MLGFLLAASLVAVVYRPLDIDRPPKPRSLRERYLLRSPEDTKLAVIDSIIESYNENEVTIARKTTVFMWAFWITAGSTALIGVAIMLHVAVQTEGLLASGPTATPAATATPTATATATATQRPAVVTPVPVATP
jgi:hypothetical protein